MRYQGNLRVVGDKIRADEWYIVGLAEHAHNAQVMQDEYVHRSVKRGGRSCRKKQDCGRT